MASLAYSFAFVRQQQGVDDMSKVDGVNAVRTELWPTNYLDRPVSAECEGLVALIVLHSPISDFEYLHRLYSHASYRICADGAANRVHEMLLKQYPDLDWKEALQKLPPDSIHGDLDSIKDTVRQRYEKIGVDISKDPDEYSTDFGKVMSKVTAKLPDLRDILVLGSIGGRVDQGIGLLSELLEQTLKHPGIRLWFFSESSVSIILQPGTTDIHTPLSLGLITQNLGILPVFGAASISTQGLEWDVQDWPTEMGGQISTSNHIVADCVTVTTDRHVLLTIERAKFT